MLQAQEAKITDVGSSVMKVTYLWYIPLPCNILSIHFQELSGKIKYNKTLWKEKQDLNYFKFLYYTFQTNAILAKDAFLPKFI